MLSYGGLKRGNRDRGNYQLQANFEFDLEFDLFESELNLILVFKTQKGFAYSKNQ